MGNCKVERAKLSAGFIPLGVKEYGGVVYIASYNPDTDECEIGSFPSPERDITGTNTIENQTGLVDGSFLTEDFVLPIQKINDEFLPEEVLSKIQKLNEPEVLKLNPGDKYITTYKVNPIMNSDVTEANFKDYFSSDPNNKAIFQIKFYKIDTGNNIIEMDPEDVKSIPYRVGIEEDEYVYYVESNGGALGVGIELNPITYFNSNVREISKRADQNKKVRLEALGEVDSSVTFEGVRVDVIKNEDEPGQEKLSFHVDKQSDVSNKVSASISDLLENDKLKVDLTPYCQFGYFPKMMQSFNLQMGVNLNGSDLNNIFRWYVRENVNRLELDFDFTQEVEGVAKMYIEFYDPWSNISTFKVIQNPSIYSTMNVIVNLIDDPKTAIFDPYPTSGTANPTNQKGGVLFNKLNPYNGEVMDPILINTTIDNGVKLIRNDDSLRKNHFYIVRICLYEETTDDTREIKRTYYNYYKALYTNTAYNTLYVEQQSISSSDVNYKPDFTKIPYPLEKIQFTGTLSKELPHVLTSSVDDYSTVPTTNYKGNNQLFNTSRRPEGNYLTIGTNHQVSKNYEIKLDKKTNMYYGRLKSNLLDIEDSFTQDVTNNMVSNSNSNNPIVNTGKLKFTKINDTAASVELDFTTTRPTRGLIIPSEQGIVQNKKYLHEYMYQHNTDQFDNRDNTYYSTSALAFTRARQNWADETADYGPDSIAAVMRIFPGNSWSTPAGSARMSQDGIDWTIRDKNEESNKVVMNKPDRLWADTPQNDQFFSYVNNHTDTRNKDYVAIIRANGTKLNWMPTGILFTYKNSGNPRTVVIPYAGVGTNNNLAVRNFLSLLYHIVIESDPFAKGYFLSPNYDYYLNELTNVNNLQLLIKTVWNLPSVKTYIFESLYGTPTYKDFSTDNINEVIARAIAANPLHSHLNNSLEDNNFIPFVTPTSNLDNYTSEVSLGNFSISLSSDELIRFLFANSKDMHDMFIADMTTNDPAVLEKIYVENIIISPGVYGNLSEFADLFKYDANGTEGAKIVLRNDSLFLNKLAAKAGSTKSFRLYYLDAYNKQLILPTSIGF